MSTTTPRVAPPKQELTIISHSNLLYWWPVWAVGFLMGILTLIHGTLLAVVPEKTVAVRDIGGDVAKHQKLSAEVVGQSTYIDVNHKAGLIFPPDFPKDKDQ